MLLLGFCSALEGHVQPLHPAESLCDSQQEALPLLHSENRSPPSSTHKRSSPGPVDIVTCRLRVCSISALCSQLDRCEALGLWVTTVLLLLI